MEPQIKYILSLASIRDRASVVLDAARVGDLTHFDFHEDRLNIIADFVVSILKIGAPSLHFQLKKLISSNSVTTVRTISIKYLPTLVGGILRSEAYRESGISLQNRISVLLDAGAGDSWRYIDSETNQELERSEGIAVTSLQMFKALTFTANKNAATPSVDGTGLQQIKPKDLVAGFKVSETNEMLGLGPRVALLNNLGKSLRSQSHVFGAESRPGNLVNYLLRNAQGSSKLDLLQLWDVLQGLLLPIWPKDRTTIDGVTVGDAWPLRVLQRRLGTQSVDEASGIQPFHKLTQWIKYSPMVPFQRVLSMRWSNVELLTCLAEYCNGGLYVDLGMLSLKKDVLERGLNASGEQLPLFDASDHVIVEWRAITLALMEVLYPMVRDRMPPGVHLTMPQMLGPGTWVAGRAMAAQLRPETKSNLILVKTDGTLF